MPNFSNDQNIKSGKEHPLIKKIYTIMAMYKPDGETILNDVFLKYQSANDQCDMIFFDLYFE